MPPLAVLGIEGLYDLPALVKYHDDLKQPIYHNFVESAFGPNATNWAAASPTNADYKSSWQDGKLAVVAHSHEDELVEWDQPELMMKALSSQGFGDSGNRRGKLIELKGKHDQVWSNGTEVARAIEWTIKEFVSMR